jgi:hypothetical protein
MNKTKVNMDKHSTCPFCGNNRKSFLVDNGYDVSAMYFYEDEDFSISPDLSPLVTGHLLVIPTKHYASFGEIVDISMLSRIRNVAESLLGTKDLLIFEHGAVIEGEGGASVDADMQTRLDSIAKQAGVSTVAGRVLFVDGEFYVYSGQANKGWRKATNIDFEWQDLLSLSYPVAGIWGAANKDSGLFTGYNKRKGANKLKEEMRR